MQTRSSDENSVSLSVRLSDKRVICDKMKELYVNGMSLLPVELMLLFVVGWMRGVEVYVISYISTLSPEHA